MAKRRKPKPPPIPYVEVPRCYYCRIPLSDLNYGGARGEGKMCDADRGLGVCVKCCEALDVIR